MAKEIQKLNKKMLDAIEYIIENPTASYEQIGNHFGVHRQTIYNWHKSPVFIEALQKRLKEVWSDAIKIAQKTMIDSALRGDIQASKYILDSNGYQAIQQIDINTNTIRVTIDD